MSYLDIASILGGMVGAAIGGLLILRAAIRSIELKQKQKEKP